MKRFLSFLSLLPKPNISSPSIKKVFGSFKGFFQLFVYKEKEMEIGLPTNVKHVTHIGLDGSTTTNQIKGWEKFQSPELISFPSISLSQFEHAMAAQGDSDKPLHLV